MKTKITTTAREQLIARIEDLIYYIETVQASETSQPLSLIDSINCLKDARTALQAEISWLYADHIGTAYLRCLDANYYIEKRYETLTGSPLNGVGECPPYDAIFNVAQELKAQQYKLNGWELQTA
jgi:hypothetical protein